MKKAFTLCLLVLLLPLLFVLPKQTSAQGSAPYGPSPVISQLTWAPASTIARAAQGSDNWPLTWGDDGNLYTAYGDGSGFEPKVPGKLSLGFARIEGSATDFTGVNIRSADEQIGDGQSGKKASGMLMVDGILYMWVRNANNAGEQCQLAWSTDHAVTWTWSDWKFAEFGYCTFINFGQNYAGARDNYVYTVTHDHPSAYEAGDHFVLMRVPKDQITNRDAYEFFQELVVYDEPSWTADINQRGAVFTNPGLARRSGISYNAALGRYLWWQGLPHAGDEKDSGGIGIFDAPEPWGPWTTVYYTENWDVGPGETGSFPTKWMSVDGKSIYLVFSGGDSFSVRQATLTVDSEPDDPDEPNPEQNEKMFLPVISDQFVEPSDQVGGFPGADWSTANPAEVGMDESRLVEARDYALMGGGSGYITRHGRLVMSWGSADQRYDLKSTTKSIGASALGLALGDGLVSLEDKAQECLPDFGVPPEGNATTGWLDDITLLHLATHTAGFAKPGGYEALLFEPGTKWSYSDGGPNWLADCLTLSFGKDLNALLFERMFTPLGITSGDLAWRSHLYREDTIGGIKRREFGSGISANVDAMARIGYLYLRNGQWDGQNLLPQSFVEAASRPAPGLAGLPVADPVMYPGASEHYGLLWWNNADGSIANVPKDAFWSWGGGDSLILVIPSLDIVAARAGSDLPVISRSIYQNLEPLIQAIAQSVIN